MIIFIDESGDPGFKTEKDSSLFLVISLLIFDKEEDSVRTSQVIEAYRKKIKYASSYEFKFRKTRKKIIVGLLESVKHCKFRIRSIILDKSQVKLGKGINNKTLYYGLLIIALEKCLDSQQDIKVRLDGIAERELRNAWRTYLRNHLKERVIDFKLVDSKNDSLIQLADIIVGSTGRSYIAGKNDTNIYKDIIKEKIEEERVIKKDDLEPILK